MNLTLVQLRYLAAVARAINADLRCGSALRWHGCEDEQRSLGRELTYQTNDGKREFAAGDRIVLLENNREFGVKNGMLGTVKAVEPEGVIIRPDSGMRNQEEARTLSIPMNGYQSVDHGDATTSHKTQGATVIDPSFWRRTRWTGI